MSNPKPTKQLKTCCKDCFVPPKEGFFGKCGNVACHCHAQPCTPSEGEEPKKRVCIFCGKEEWNGAFPASCAKGLRRCVFESKPTPWCSVPDCNVHIKPTPTEAPYEKMKRLHDEGLERQKDLVDKQLLEAFSEAAGKLPETVGKALVEPQKDWRERFDEEFCMGNGTLIESSALEIKHFIRKEIQQAEERGRREAKNIILGFSARIRKEVLADLLAHLDFKL